MAAEIPRSDPINCTTPAKVEPGVPAGLNQRVRNPNPTPSIHLPLPQGNQGNFRASGFRFSRCAE